MVDDLRDPVNPPEDEFDDFLRRLADDPSLKVDRKAIRTRVEQGWRDALAASGYQSLEPGTEVHDVLLEAVTKQMHGLGVYDPVEIEAALEHSVKLMNMRRTAMMTVILMVAAREEFSRAVGDYDVEQQNDLKRFLYASLLVEHEMTPDHPIVVAMNMFISGDDIHPDDEEVIPYMLQAMEKHANSEQRLSERLALVKEFHQVLGIPEDIDPTMTYVLDTAMIYGYTVANGLPTANRDAFITEHGRDSGLGEDDIRKIIDFINQKLPQVEEE
jgi:hypothetical protein